VLGAGVAPEGEKELTHCSAAASTSMGSSSAMARSPKRSRCFLARQAPTGSLTIRGGSTERRVNRCFSSASRTESIRRPTIDGWPAAFGQGSSHLRHSPGIVEGSTQQHLDLGVGAAELIGCPPSQGIMDSGINSQ